MICRVLKLITASTVKVFHQLFLYQSIATEKLYIFAFGFDKIVQSARPQIQGKRQPLPLTFRFAVIYGRMLHPIESSSKD